MTRLKTWKNPTRDYARTSGTTRAAGSRRQRTASLKNLAVRLGGEGELELAGAVEDAVAALLRVRVDVGEPADAAAGHGLEVRAVLVEHVEVRLLLCDGGLRACAVRVLAAVLYRGRPSVLSARSISVRVSPRTW